MLAASPPAQTHLHVAHLVAVLWPLWLLLGLVVVGKLVHFLWLEHRLRASGIREIDVMDGHTFERRLRLLFRDLGYRVELTGSKGGDYGCDLLVSKAGRRTAVQAKCWKKTVGVKAVQEALGARGFYRADAALVVTNRSFSRQAIQLARANNVSLWNREELIKLLLRVNKNHDATPAEESRYDDSSPAPL